jgi:hypothetical protein
MRVLVACEFSGVVRDAFAARGHEAWSCDLLPSEKPGNHIIGDALETAHKGHWDLMIAHPPCTYLANSGVRWLDIINGKITNKEREDNMLMASQFFLDLLSVPIKKKVIENPIPHKYANLPKYDQIIQPWQFGHGETKATCLWITGLPELTPTNIVEGRRARVHKATPGPDRWKERSRTLAGIGKAFAEQWG